MPNLFKSNSFKFAIVYFSITAVLCVLAIIFVNWLENREIEKIRDEARIEYTEVEYICTDIKTDTYQTYDGEITSETTYYFDPTDTETFDDWDYGFHHKNATNFNTKEPFILHTAHVLVNSKWYTRINSDNLSLEDFTVVLKSELDEKISTYVNTKCLGVILANGLLFVGCPVLIFIGIYLTYVLKN